MDYDISQTIPTPNDYYFLQIKSQQNSGEVTVYYSETVFDGLPVGIDKPAAMTNTIYGLNQNIPNPFNPGAGPTNISFNLQKSTKVNITIYDIKGQKVKTLADAVFQSGTHNLYWDGRNTNGQDVSSGIYFYKLEAQDIKQIKKCILLRF